MPTQIKVNGEALAEEDIRAEVASLRASLEAHGQELTFEQRLQLREQATESVIEKMLVTQEAARLKLADVQQLVGHWGRKVKPTSQAEIRDYYRTHQAQFLRPEAVHASHFVKNNDSADAEQNRALLGSIRDRLRAGEDLTALAKEHSDCPENGGDLGFFPRGVMVDEFDDVVFAAPLHEPTDVFETPFGLHIAVVHERRSAGIAELPEVAARIADGLYREKLDREIGARLAALRRNARIEGI